MPVPAPHDEHRVASGRPEPDPSETRDPAGGDAEELDALPVLAEVRTLAPERADAVPASPLAGSQVTMQAAAVAATGFVAGAATVAMLHRRKVRKLARSSRRKGAARVPGLLEVVGSRSFLVDVHLLGSRD